MLNKTIKQILLVIIFSGLSLAQTKDSLDFNKYFQMDLEELMNVKVNVSSLEAKNVFNSPSTVTIIDQQQIKTYGFTTIPEALQSIAGIDVLQTIIDKNVTTSRGVLQNFYANKILLLINNIPTYQPINGDGHLERIDINDIERIEVLKGPASVLYGSNAYSGVVNLVLKTSSGFDISAFGSFGFSKYYRSGININYSKNDFNLFVSANSRSEEKDGYQMMSRRGALHNGDSTFIYYENEYQNNFNILANYKAHSIYINFFDFDHSYLGAEPSYRSGANKLIHNIGKLINYRFENYVNKKIIFNADISYDYFNRDLPLSQDNSNMTRIEAERFQGRLNFNYKVNEKIQFETGASFELRLSLAQETRNGITDKLINLNQSKEENQYEFSLYSQLYYKLGKINLLAGGRYTNNELFGNNFSYRLTGTYLLGDKEAIKMIYGESFRVPTFLELYFIHPTVIGNPNLTPEKSKSIELAYLKGIKNFYFQFLGYYAFYDNLIQRYTDESGPPSKYRNFSSLEGYGIEAEMKYNLSNNFNAFLNYNYIQSADEDEKDVYKYVPDHNISAGISKLFDDFSISANLTYYSSVFGNLAKIDPQVKVNLNFGFRSKIKEFRLKHSVSIKNIFNSDMLIPEYIRKTPNINSLPTTGFGRRIIYTLSIYY